jgi:hypothetical protein
MRRKRKPERGSPGRAPFSNQAVNMRLEVQCKDTRWQRRRTEKAICKTGLATRAIAKWPGVHLEVVPGNARQNRGAGVLAREFGRRPAARIRRQGVFSQRDAAGTGSRDGCATRTVSSNPPLASPAFLLDYRRGNKIIAACAFL